MSKNIIIEKEGVATSLSGVEMLRTALAEGGSVDWVPEDECVVAPITITQNGTYEADDESLYGFDVVTVNVPADTVEGYINGVKYIVSVDANGYLVYTEVGA